MKDKGCHPLGNVMKPWISSVASLCIYPSLYPTKSRKVTEESHAGICVYLSLKQSQETGSFVHMGFMKEIHTTTLH